MTNICNAFVESQYFPDPECSASIISTCTPSKECNFNVDGMLKVPGISAREVFVRRDETGERAFVGFESECQ